MYNVSTTLWVTTLVWFAALILADLFLNRRKWHYKTDLPTAIRRSIIWIGLGLGLGLVIWNQLGSQAAASYYTAFVIEKALSINNIFVWSLILTYFAIPKELHHRVLFWGVLGAIILRTIFVIAGSALINEYQIGLVLLGALLLYAGFGELSRRGHQLAFSARHSRLIRFAERVLPISEDTSTKAMFIKKHGHRKATLLLLSVIVVVLTDFLFALDSIPAVLAVARDPYIALASNIAAVLGLHALYYVYEGIESHFWLLNRGLGVILVAAGCAAILEPTQLLGREWYGLEIDPILGFSFVITTISLSIIGSILLPTPNQDIDVNIQ